MKYRPGVGLLIGAACVLLSGYLWAQQPPAPPAPPAGEPAPPADSKPAPPANPPDAGPAAPPAPTEPGDPTQPSDRLREILGRGKTLNGAAPKLPLIAVRGRVVVKDKPPAALLEVNGQVQLVSKDSVLVGPANTTLKVTDLTRSTVTILVMPQNETIVLH